VVLDAAEASARQRLATATAVMEQAEMWALGLPAVLRALLLNAAHADVLDAQKALRVIEDQKAQDLVGNLTKVLR
jgi:hypothetical protein